MVALFLFLKGMTGAMAPFNYLVENNCRFCDRIPRDEIPMTEFLMAGISTFLYLVVIESLHGFRQAAPTQCLRKLCQPIQLLGSLPFVIALPAPGGRIHNTLFSS